MTYTKLLRRLDPSLQHATDGQVPSKNRTQAGWQVHRVADETGEIVLELTKQTATGDCLRTQIRIAA